MPRQLAITKQVDLSDIAPGWDGCYVTVTPASYTEFIELKRLQEKADSQTEVLELGLTMAREHFVDGQILILDEGANKKVAMEAEDLAVNRRIADLVLTSILEVPPDPKGSSTATATS